MADIRINALATTAASTASDDFVAVDGSANGTRKLNAYSPTFGGNVTVSGGLLTLNNATESYVELKIAGTAKGYLDQLPSTLNVLGLSGVDVDIYAGGNNPANRVAKFAASGIATTLYGNLTVSGTGTSDFSGNVRLANTKAIYGYTFAGATGALISSSASDNLNVGQNNANWAALNLYGGTGNVDVYSGATGFVARFNTNGNFLLGTTTDGGQKLQVNGTGLIKADIGGNGYVLKVNNIGGNSVLQLMGSTAACHLLTATSGSLYFYTNGTDGSVGPNALILDSSQNATFAGTVTASKAGTAFYSIESTVNGAISEVIVKGKNSTGTAREARLGLNKYADDVFSIYDGTTERFRLGLTNGNATITGALAIGNTVQTAASVASTHKVTISIGGSTYYLLATNV